MSDQPSDQPLPAGLVDVAAETEVIGGLLRQPEITPQVVNLLPPAAFTQARHNAAFDAVLDAFKEGADPTVAKVRGLMHTAGDASSDLAEWLADLRSNGPLLAADVVAAADKVKSLAAKRRINEALGRAAVAVRDVAADDTQALGTVHEMMTSLVVDAPLSETLHDGATAVYETLERIEKAGNTEGLPGLSTGSADLDEVLQGLRGGQLVVVGARPGSGKSVVGVDWLRAALAQGVGVLHFSFEMSRHEIMMRILSAESGIDHSKIQSGKLSTDEFALLGQVSARYAEHPLTVVDAPGVTASQIAALSTQMARTWTTKGVDLGLIVWDYLQITPETTTGRRESSRQQALGEITRSAKTMARQLDVPVLLISAVGRASEHAADKTPSMKDLRESGDIENDADVVILLHKPDDYVAEDRPGELDFIFAKNRGGITRRIARQHNYRTMKTNDLQRIPPSI